MGLGRWVRQNVAISHIVIEGDMTTQIEQPMTSQEVCSLLGISRRTLHRWRRLRKGPPAIKVGRAVVYRREAVERWLVAQESDAGRGATVAGRH
ncbi:helix-turn-helix transcriptional regulator [Novosphingobium pokkalii]